MKAVLATDAPEAVVGDITLKSTLDPLEVLVEVEASAMCLTELHSLGPGPTYSPHPAVIGHSASARVLEVGAAVTRVAVGDRVAVCSTLQCDECWYCRHGAPAACVDLLAHCNRVVGVDEAGRDVTADMGLGTHAERMIYTQSALVRIDSDLPADPLALLGCGILAGLGAVLEVGRVSAGQSVAISGVGPLGSWMVQGARLAGAEIIIAIDPIPERRAIAQKLGATHALDLTDDIVERVQELTEGRGVDVGLEAAGTVSAMEQSFSMTRQGGVVVPTGVAFGQSVKLDALEYALFAREIRSSQGGGGNILADVPKFTRMLDDGLLDWESVITARYPIGDAVAAYHASRERVGLTSILYPNP